MAVTYTLAQCSPSSVELTQARPNKCTHIGVYGYKVNTPIQWNVVYTADKPKIHTT